MDAEAIEFPLALGKVARRELGVHGLTRYAQLTEWTATDLLALHGVGPKAVRILRDELVARGMSLKGE
jgi:predicted flap endonuclease-1-like 5' DNA nuclease